MNNAAFDVAIGLVMMYLLLSLLCTIINEFISAIAGLRSRTLMQAIGKIIDSPDLHADFYKHGLIDTGKLVNGSISLPYLSSQNFAMAIIDSLDTKKTMPQFSDIENSVKDMPDSNIRDTLLINLMLSGGNVEKLRDNIANWFDRIMDHVSDVYKRKLRILSFIVGLAVAVLINADSINVTKSLWHDRALRAQMIDSADKILPQNQVVTIQDVMLVENELRPLPLGWDLEHIRPDADWRVEYYFWIYKAAGLLLTGIALSLGAPFWFDILSKIINIRGTVNKPDLTAGAIGK